jgi:hypothetical protein
MLCRVGSYFVRRCRRFRLRLRRSLFRAGCGGLHKLWDAGLDRLVGRELGLGVEFEVAPRPVERADHRVVAQSPVALGVKQMAEEKVERGRLPVPIMDREGARRPLTLSSLQN